MAKKLPVSKSEFARIAATILAGYRASGNNAQLAEVYALRDAEALITSIDRDFTDRKNSIPGEGWTP